MHTFFSTLDDAAAFLIPQMAEHADFSSWPRMERVTNATGFYEIEAVTVDAFGDLAHDAKARAALSWLGRASLADRLACFKRWGYAREVAQVETLNAVDRTMLEALARGEAPAFA